MTNTEKKYLDFLKELRNDLKTTDKVSLTNYIKKYKLNARTSGVLIEQKIVKKTGEHSTFFRYTWNTIEPNIYMAKKLIEVCNTKNLDAQHNFRKKQKEILEKEYNIKRSVKKRYTKEEEQFIFENSNLSNKALAKKLGRTVSSIEMYFKNRGINNSNNIIQKQIPKVEKTNLNKKDKKQFSLLWGLIKISW